MKNFLLAIVVAITAAFAYAASSEPSAAAVNVRVAGCINLNGVELCIGAGGSNCHWYKGYKYCSHPMKASNCYWHKGKLYCTKPVAKVKCYWHNGKKYCSSTVKSDCFWKNGVKYCATPTMKPHCFWKNGKQYCY